MSQLRKLFEPIKVGNLDLKNRIVMPAMMVGLGANDMVTDRFKDFYAERARGGVGLIVIGLATATYPGPFFPGGIGVYKDELIPGLREFADLMHERGARVAVQISALGILAGAGGNLELVGPSDTNVDAHPNAPKPRPLTTDEIRQVVEAYGEAARRAQEAGFDAVELNAIGGTSLISHFLSAHTNKRTDGYGNGVENRARLLLECIESVKQKVGKDYPLLCRVSGADFMEGGNTIEDTKIVAPIMEKAGIHAINVSTGWHESPVPFIQMSVPRASWVYLAEEVKNVVNIPVIGGTRIPDPDLAEQIVAEGRVDMVYIARALIADPEWPNKAREGRLDEIRSCTACCMCFDGVIEQRSITCSVNARAGREAEYSIEPANERKKVFIIGGGPAGMEAARVAAMRGHHVTLADSKGQLGGQLLVAVLPPHKDELSNLIKYLAGQMDKLGVNVRLGEEVSSGTIEKAKPDVVIVATGATPIIPDISGARGKNVATATDVLTGQQQVGENVLVIGGGMIGCETAEFLAEKGKKVTILEMLGRIGADIERAVRWVVMDRLRSLGIRMERNAKVEEITGSGAKVSRDGSTEFFKADSVVLAVGMESDHKLSRELEGKVAALHVIGDAAEPGKIAKAIESGLGIARTI